MSRYKVLEAPNWLLRIEERPHREQRAETREHYEEIDPFFGRPGWYYDRHTKKAWYESGDRAWQCDRNSFRHALSMQDHKPLLDKEREAIQLLMTHRHCPKEMRELLFTDTNWRQLRRVKRGARLWVMKFRKEKG